jgi:hypothetical protein
VRYNNNGLLPLQTRYRLVSRLPRAFILRLKASPQEKLR